nr:hypothetical protein [Streptomyces sp. F001]
MAGTQTGVIVTKGADPTIERCTVDSPRKLASMCRRAAAAAS